MKVTVLGARGMAGHIITKYLQQKGHRVSPVTRTELDIENQQQVSEFFDTLDADFVVNCTGLLVKDSINRPDRAALVNSWFPHYAAYRLSTRDIKLIHLSTDCVFNGSKGNYNESDIHTESNAYGRSKSLGEVNNTKDVTFRMSIIGPELKNGTGLLNWVLTSTDSELPGWTNAWWNGITTLELAKCINRYIADPKITGVYHVVSNANRINKYDLLREINRVYGLNKTIVPTQGPKSIDKVLVDTRKEFDFGIPSYQQQLEESRQFNPLAHVSPLTS